MHSPKLKNQILCMLLALACRIPSSVFLPVVGFARIPSSAFRLFSSAFPPVVGFARIPSSAFRFFSSVFPPVVGFARIPSSVFRLFSSLFRLFSSAFLPVAGFARIPSSAFRLFSSAFLPVAGFARIPLRSFAFSLLAFLPVVGFTRTPLLPFSSSHLLAQNEQEPSSSQFFDRANRQPVVSKQITLVDVGLGPESTAQLADAMTILRAPSSTDSDKEKARNIVRDNLEFLFDREQAKRKLEAENTAKMLAKIRATLDKRATKKDEILELKMRVLDLELKGLSVSPSSSYQINTYSSSVETSNSSTLNSYPLQQTNGPK